jgi:hypothetical protein
MEDDPAYMYDDGDDDDEDEWLQDGLIDDE